MKEKKTVACVVLGVALVSLITAAIAGFAESIVEMTNEHYSNMQYTYTYYGVLLGGVILSAAFITLFSANKKHRFIVNLSLAAAVIVYFIISIIVLKIPGYYVYRNFEEYLAMALTFMVSTALVLGAWLYLQYCKKEEAKKQSEETKSEAQSEEANKE